MKSINLIMPFSRAHLKDDLIRLYEPMDIIIYQIMFESESYIDFKREWVKPFFVPYPRPPALSAVNAVNYFLRNHEFLDDDYYVLAPDDDMYAPGVFDSIKKMDDDIIIISMDRGGKTSFERTLRAEPNNMRVNFVGGEQVFAKGKIFKNIQFEIDYFADGKMVEKLKEKHAFRYEPELFVLFNYLNPEWWTEQTWEKCQS